MKTILITGSNSEIATEYIKADYKKYDRVIAHYRKRHDRLDILQDMFGDKIVPIQADLSDGDELDQFLKQIEIYQPGVFFHVAAPKFRYMRFEKTDIREFELEMQVVYWSFLNICRQILPDMAKKKEGRIVALLTELTVHDHQPYLSHYVSSKYALLGLVKSLAVEYAKKNIRVNALSPGMIETDFLSEIPSYIITDNAKKTWNQDNLHPTDLVPMIRFLLSDQSKMINGQNILLQ